MEHILACEKACQHLLYSYRINEEENEEIVLEQVFNSNLSLKSKQLIVEYFELPIVNINWKSTGIVTPVSFKKLFLPVWNLVKNDNNKMILLDNIIQQIDIKDNYAKLIDLVSILI